MMSKKDAYNMFIDKYCISRKGNIEHYDDIVTAYCIWEQKIKDQIDSNSEATSFYWCLMKKFIRIIDGHKDVYLDIKILRDEIQNDTI